jgi:hypothetical protein
MRKMITVSAQRSYRQFYYGGAEEVAEAMRIRIVVIGGCFPGAAAHQRRISVSGSSISSG